MSDTPEYRVAFAAVGHGSPDGDARRRLERALRDMPGIGDVEEVGFDDEGRRVVAAFVIAVRLGMADAARDGSRLAKEALKAAGMAESHLVELAVSLRGAEDAT